MQFPLQSQGDLKPPDISTQYFSDFILSITAHINIQKPIHERITNNIAVIEMFANNVIYSKNEIL